MDWERSRSTDKQREARVSPARGRRQLLHLCIAKDNVGCRWPEYQSRAWYIQSPRNGCFLYVNKVESMWVSREQTCELKWQQSLSAGESIQEQSSETPSYWEQSTAQRQGNTWRSCSSQFLPLSSLSLLKWSPPWPGQRLEPVPCRVQS